LEQAVAWTRRENNGKNSGKTQLKEYLGIVMKQVWQLRALKYANRGAGHRFPWPARLTVQGRRQKTIACPTRTQFATLVS
jgi:hypothetical protein